MIQTGKIIIIIMALMNIVAIILSIVALKKGGKKSSDNQDFVKSLDKKYVTKSSLDNYVKKSSLDAYVKYNDGIKILNTYIKGKPDHYLTWQNAQLGSDSRLVAKWATPKNKDDSTDQDYNTQLKIVKCDNTYKYSETSPTEFTNCHTNATCCK